MEKIRAIKVRLIFQPAEETHIGAEQVITSGDLEGVDLIVGYHKHPNLPIGQISAGKGRRNAAVDKLVVKLTGGLMVMLRHMKILTPFLALTSTVTGLQSIISRSLNSYRQSVLLVIHIKGSNMKRYF